jgi:hypothetical protein
MLQRILRTLAILLALTLSWLSRYVYDPDGVAYVDVARAWLRGDWHNALNTYWSPLYSWLIAISFGILHPPIAWETWVLHAIVFLGFLFSLCAGEWLMREWERRQGPPAHRSLTTVAFYALFLWASLNMTGMDFTSADIVLLGIWFLAGGFMLRIGAGGTVGDAVWLGVTLAFGLFTKGGFLSSIPVFLLMLVVMIGLRDRRLYAAVAAVACVLLPYAAALSIAHHRLVLTDAGRLNYSWLVNLNVVEGYHETGAEPPENIPHPVRRLIDHPRVLSYQDHLVGTIPIHSDAAWWSEGYPVTFDPGMQTAIFLNEGWFTLLKSLRSPALLFFLICIVAGEWTQSLQGLARLWFLWAPALISLLTYSAIHVLPRYIAPPLGMLGFVLIAAGWKSRFPPRLLPFVLAVVTAMSVWVLRWELASPKMLVREWTGAREPLHIGNVRIAGYLHSRSPDIGPRIGLIGSSIAVPWLELAGGQIAAVVPGRLGNESWAPGRPLTLSFGEPDLFWSSNPATQEQVFRAMRAAGANWAVADSVPVWADVSGWEIAGEVTYPFRPASVQRPWCYVRRLY